MGATANALKTVELGMAFGTAMHRLRKLVLFALLQKYDEDTCCRCGQSIESADELSMEHKEPWLGVDPALFWDLDNIGFSHLVCNIRSARRVSTRGQPRPGYQPENKKIGPAGTTWCGSCKRFRPLSEFHVDQSRWDGLRNRCKACRRST